PERHCHSFKYACADHLAEDTRCLILDTGWKKKAARGKHPASSIQYPASFSPINLAHNDIYASEYDHNVRHGMAQAKIFQDRQVDETGGADAVTIRIRTAVAY